MVERYNDNIIYEFMVISIFIRVGVLMKIIIALYLNEKRMNKLAKYIYASLSNTE